LPLPPQKNYADADVAQRDDFLTNLDRLVALASRGLLVPV
jgi:hypothetical protein